MRPFEDRGAYCCGHVVRSVDMLAGLSVYPQTCATYHWKMLNPVNFKLSKLIIINMKMIPIPQWVKVKAIFSFVAEEGISVLQISLVCLETPQLYGLRYLITPWHVVPFGYMPSWT